MKLLTVYLSNRILRGKHKKDIHVYGFGEQKKALAKMYDWGRDFRKFPLELEEMYMDIEI